MGIDGRWLKCSKQAIPKGEGDAIIGVLMLQILSMVGAVEAGGDQEEAHETIEALGESGVGVNPKVVGNRKELSCKDSGD